MGHVCVIFAQKGSSKLMVATLRASKWRHLAPKCKFLTAIVIYWHLLTKIFLKTVYFHNKTWSMGHVCVIYAQTSYSKLMVSTLKVSRWRHLAPKCTFFTAFVKQWHLSTKIFLKTHYFHNKTWSMDDLCVIYAKNSSSKLMVAPLRASKWRHFAPKCPFFTSIVIYQHL